MLPDMSMLTVRGAAPLNLSIAAAIRRGVPVAPPMRTIALWRLERFSSLSIACVLIRYAPAGLIWKLVAPAVLLQEPLAPLPVSQSSHATDSPTGAVTGSLPVTVVPPGP